MPKTDINDLRRDRRAAADKMKTAAAALTELENAETAPEQAELDAAQAAFDAAKAAFDKADKQVQREEATERAIAAAAVSSDAAPVAGQDGGAPAQAKRDADRGIGAALIVAALARAKDDHDAAAQWLEREGHSGLSASLSGLTPGAGGVTIPDALAGELIPLLRPKVVVRRAGAVSSPMPAGKLRRARQTGGASASYGPELGAIAESEPTFDQVDQDFKKLTCLIGISNDLWDFSSMDIGRVTLTDMIRTMSTTEDLAFLRYDGTGNRPTGVRWWAGAGMWAATPVAKDGDAAELAVDAAVNRVEDSDVPMLSPGWVMRPSAKNWLASLRLANGFKRFPSIDADMTLRGYPIYTTSQVPDNLGVGGDETEITFADFSEIAIGDAKTIRVATSSEATFVNQSGDTVSAFQTDQTLMRAISEHDLAALHDVAIAGFNGVGWSL